MARPPAALVLVGSPVVHSLSPTFQRAALAAAGIDVSYDPLEVSADDLARTFNTLRVSNTAGNVTRPHKIRVHDLCAELTPAARRAGAVNTFWWDDGRLTGDNTDVAAFDVAARALLEAQVDDLTVTVLGAGGAASAVLTALEHWNGIQIGVVSRRPAQGAALARRYADVARVEMDALRAAARSKLIVNATPIGQHDDLHPLAVSALPPQAVVFDLVYRRGGTSWVRAARERGNTAQDGLPMLLEQGALAFRRWFGIDPDREVMRRSVA